MRPFLSRNLSEAPNGELSRPVWTEVLGSAVGRDGACADDTSTGALLHHLLCGEDVRVDEAEEVYPHFILDEPAMTMLRAVSRAAIARERNSLGCALKQGLHLGDTSVRNTDEQPWAELLDCLCDSSLDLLRLADV